MLKHTIGWIGEYTFWHLTVEEFVTPCSDPTMVVTYILTNGDDVVTLQEFQDVWTVTKNGYEIGRFMGWSEGERLASALRTFNLPTLTEIDDAYDTYREKEGW